MLKTHKRLRNYTQAHSHKIWLDYRKFLEATNSVPNSFTEAIKAYNNCIVFHTNLMTAVNTLEYNVSNKWERGCHHMMQGFGRIEVHLYSDEFNIVFIPPYSTLLWAIE